MFTEVHAGQIDVEDLGLGYQLSHAPDEALDLLLCFVIHAVRIGRQAHCIVAQVEMCQLMLLSQILANLVKLCRLQTSPAELEHSQFFVRLDKVYKVLEDQTVAESNL